MIKVAETEDRLEPRPGPVRRCPEVQYLVDRGTHSRRPCRRAPAGAGRPGPGELEEVAAFSVVPPGYVVQELGGGAHFVTQGMINTMIVETTHGVVLVEPHHS